MWLKFQHEINIALAHIRLEKQSAYKEKEEAKNTQNFLA